MKPFDEGVRAFQRGNLVNPYNPDTSRYRDWEFGFNTAYFSNLKAVKEKEANATQRKTQEA